MNKKNRKAIKFGTILKRITVDMFCEYNEITDKTVINLDDIQDDIEMFKELDKRIVSHSNLELYNDFEECLEDVRSLLSTYARLSAYQELLDEEFEVESIITILDDNILKKFDSVLLGMYEKDVLTFVPFAMSYILEVFQLYDIEMLIDQKGDIARAALGRDRKGSTRTEYIIKRFFVL